MRKLLLRIFIAALSIVILGSTAWVALRPSEPVYQGKRLSYWLKGYHFNDKRPEHQKADEAVRQIGTNAFPTLLRMLSEKDSDLTIKLRKLARKQHIIEIEYPMAEISHNHASDGFKALGAKAKDAVPVLIEIYNQNISEDSQFTTAEVLGFIGPAASSAVPSLLRGATNANDRVRWRTIWTLGAIHSNPESVVPVLTKALNDSYLDVRWRAANALGEFGTTASPAVPALTKLLKDNEERVRDAAQEALDRISPQTPVIPLK